MQIVLIEIFLFSVILKNLKGDEKINNIIFGCYIYQDSLGKDIKHIALE